MKDKFRKVMDFLSRDDKELQRMEQENRVSFAPPTLEDLYNNGKPSFVYQKLGGQWRKVHFRYGAGCPPTSSGQEGDIYVSKAWSL